MEIDTISNFYNEWPYPNIGDKDLRTLISQGFRDKSDPTVNWNKFFKNKEKFSKINILVAGCGTYQAGLVAIRNPYADIIGIDISENSINFQRKLCDKENLSNLKLITSSILDYETDILFDLIICSGVLHHTIDPLKNLRKLSSCLKPNGIISLMVYNESIRQGVYKIQNLIKILNLNPNYDNAETVSKLIQLLDHHSLEKYIQLNPELQYLNNFMDTFFNPREISYNPINIRNLIKMTDLFFVDWLSDNYNIDKRLGKNHPLYSHIVNLDVFEQAYCIDLIKEDLGTIDIILGKMDTTL